MTTTLWHIELSHYSEKVRWALDFKSVAHRRRVPLVGLHQPIAMALTRSRHRRMPVLRLDGRSVGDSTAIIAALEARHPPPPLYPAGEAERARALEFEDYFDEELAPAVRAFAWNHVLNEPGGIGNSIAPTRPLVRRMLNASAPLAGKIIRGDYGATAERSDASRRTIIAAAERIERELGPSAISSATASRSPISPAPPCSPRSSRRPSGPMCPIRSRLRCSSYATSSQRARRAAGSPRCTRATAARGFSLRDGSHRNRDIDPCYGSPMGALLDRVDVTRGEAPPSPAGPISAEEANALPSPPAVPLARHLQILRFNQRQIEFVFKANRHLGEVWSMRAYRDDDTVTSHPDHVRSLFTAKPEEAPSLTGESPLRPIVGPNSVLTAVGPRHMRQRKLLLPPFHGEAIERYAEMISDAAEREIDRWPIGEPLTLAPRMQAITLDVIMAGIFGIEGRPERGTPEHGLRTAVRKLVDASTWPIAQLAELVNIGSDEPVGPTKIALAILDRPTYQVIAKRRGADDLGERRDILSLLLQATTEDGQSLTDQELRDELLTLVLAGHETTANSLAWAWERLVRFPDAYDRLRDAVRSGDGADDEVERVIQEAMRSRPVIPMIGRRVAAPWQLGEYAVPAGTPVLMSILLIHHREDLYPDPFAFRPERWEDRKPGTYDWIPFGGGIRRCLGAALAMAEQRVVLEAMARRLDLEADDPAPEHAVHRNVTMIPARGARVIVRSKTA